jgi:hypothetical protein
MHELINAEMYTCEGVPDGGKPKPKYRENVIVCNEAFAYEAAAACIAGTECTGTGRAKCMCEAGKAGLIANYSCRAAFLRTHCARGTVPTPEAVGQVYGGCAASAESIRRAAEAQCPKE